MFLYIIYLINNDHYDRHLTGVFPQPEEKKKKKERFEMEPEVEVFHPSMKVEVEQQGDRPVRACRTQQGKKGCLCAHQIPPVNQENQLFCF